LKNEIRILLLEDHATDAELVRLALKQGGLNFCWKHVDNRNAFVQELERFIPDLILSDFSLPSFDGYTALAIAREKCPDSPFIFVTGTLGEETAIETLKKGATDYVLKHRLARLVPSVHRAMREARERTERKRAEEQLRHSHQQLRALSMHLQDVREQERIRIAREVHDGLGQELTGLKLQLTWLTNRLPRNPKTLQEKARFIGRIDRTIHAVRRIATELRPAILDNAGLLAALEWQAQEFESQTGIRCRVKSSLPDTDWNQDLNTTFFRIFQETLTNVIRHSQASKVDVRLAEKMGQFVMVVHDNGRGITREEIENTKSIGLLGMRERAALLDGAVRFRGVPRKGTTVTVIIPRPALAVAGPLPDNSDTYENSAHRRSRRGAARLEAHSG
jgi:two-component system sensor histidine kinase UhpB